MTYLDNILIYSDNKKKYIGYILQVLRRLHKQNLQVDVDKCEFSTKKIKYLSITITTESIKIDIKKTDAIQK